MESSEGNYQSNRKTKSRKPADSQAPAFRSPPNSIQAEEAVLGGILLDNQALDSAVEILEPEDFYKGSHQVIFQAMATLADLNEPLDPLTISDQLRKHGNLERAGGIESISHLSSRTHSAAHAAYYAKIVKEMSLRRRVIHEASQLIDDAFQTDSEVDEFIDKAEQKILAVSETRSRKAFVRIGDVVQDSIKTVEKLYDEKEPITGVATGFKKLDEMTAGFQPADLVIIAARPSMGKTALALSMCQHVGVENNNAVALFSLEMSKEQLVMRMLCSTGKVDSSRVRTGHLADRDFPKLVDAASKIADASVYIDDTPSLSITEMRAKCRRLHRDTPLKLIIVDYLQLMRSPAYSSSREQEISDISRSLKGIAKELNVPVIALSQLNRSLESRTDKRPIMSDLRESGAIEQDADIITFIYRDEVYNEDTTDKGVAELIIAKQRNGPTGIVRMAFIPQLTLFANLDEQHGTDDEFRGDDEIDFSELDPDLF